MKNIEQFKLRELMTCEKPGFTPEWNITNDENFILIPKTELAAIYIVSTDDYHKINKIETKDNNNNLIHPVWVNYVHTEKNKGSFFIADNIGRMWAAKDNLLENTVYSSVNELHFELFSNSADWANDIGKKNKNIDLNIWKIAIIEIKNRQYMFVLGYLSLSDVRGCVRIIDIANKTHIDSIYPIDEAPADLAFIKENNSIYVLITTGRGGTIRQFHYEGDLLKHNEMEPITHQEMLLPVKIKADPQNNGFWVSSGNNILHILSKKEIQCIQIGNNVDVVADFDFSNDGRKIYATCLFSNRLAIITIEDNKLCYKKLPQPCWVKTGKDNKVFIFGYNNEIISVINIK